MATNSLSVLTDNDSVDFATLSSREKSQKIYDSVEWSNIAKFGLILDPKEVNF